MNTGFVKAGFREACPAKAAVVQNSVVKALSLGSAEVDDPCGVEVPVTASVPV